MSRIIAGNPLRAAIAFQGRETDTTLRSTVAAGLAIVGLFVFGFLGWAMFAHLNSAVIADGAIVADSHTKTIQNLEGGILRELLVKDGDKVTSGQALAYLDSTQADSDLGQMTNQYWTARAKVARLKAEIDDKREIVFPDDLMEQGSDPGVAETIATQKRNFESRWRAYDGQISVVQKKIDQFREEIEAGQASVAASMEQMSLTERELSGAKALYEKGLETLTRVLQLQRSIAELKGKISDRRGDIGKAKQAVAGAQAEMQGLRDSRSADIGKELQDTMALQSDFGDKLRAAKDVKQRRAIVAPQDGVVVNLKVFTVGGVLSPGQAMMDIVPMNDALVVEAKIRPSDIDVVREGLPAQVRFSAYKRIEVPPVEGRVITVSADKLEEPRTGEPYFASRIAVDATSLKHVTGIKLQPGMPAEVTVVVDKRRAINYFLEPLTERLDRSFHEQ
jgi:HlyD family secretion protein